MWKFIDPLALFNGLWYNLSVNAKRGKIQLDFNFLHALRARIRTAIKKWEVYPYEPL